MTTPIISIVIPVYNVEQYVERCLLSCINQTYKNIEIIVINDGSPDNSQFIIDRIAKTDNRITTYSQANIGLGLTRNRGIDLAKGEYIYFLDSDDFLPEDAIERLVNQIGITNNFDIVVGNFIKVDFKGNKIPNVAIMECVIQDTIATSINDRYHYFFDHEHILTFACNKLYSTSFIRDKSLRFSANNRIYAEDMLFNLKVFMCRPRIKIANVYTYFYFKNTDSITSSYKENMALRWSNLLNEYVDEMSSRNTIAEFKNIIPLICGIALSNISYNVVRFKSTNKQIHRQELEIFYTGTSMYYDKKFIAALRQVKDKVWSLYYRIVMRLFYWKKISLTAEIQSMRMRINCK